MKPYLFLFFLTIVCRISAQQSAGVVYGKLNPGDIEMKFDPIDSTAEAVLLYEKQNVYFTASPGYYINSEYHARVRIFKASASGRGNISLTCWANDNDREKIYDIEGITYNMENGKLVETVLPATSVFEEKVSDQRYVKKILLSNVKEGSVIEYRYKRKTPFSVNNTPREWFFQGVIPFKWSELAVSLPADIHYRLLFTGYLPLHINTTQKTYERGEEVTKYRLVVKDAPSFKDEPYITSHKDYISKVEFGLVSYYVNNGRELMKFSNSFGDIARFLNRHERFGEAIRETGYPKGLIATFDAIGDSTEKLNAIFRYMTKHFEWNGQNRLLTGDGLDKVFENGKGSSSELNLLLLQLLRGCGFKADPVIISTRENGEIKEEYPMLDKFNYVLVRSELNGKEILMDVTDPNLSPGLLPAQCLSNKGYAVLKDTVSAVSLRPAKSTLFVLVNAELDTAGTMKGTLSESMDSYNGLSYRNFIKENNEKALYHNFQKMAPDWEISGWKTGNYEDPFKPLKLSFDFSESFVLTDNKLFFNPMFFNQTKENLFNEKDRLYPVDIGNPYEYVFILNLKLPEKFVIEHSPRPVSISLPDKGGKYTYVVETEGDMLKIRSRVMVASSYYPSGHYRSLREMYQMMIEKEAEQVVLKKL